MPDTGAPWNIPYVEPADLVRDYRAADEAQALAIAAGLTAAGNDGIGANVVQAVKTDVFTTTSGTYTDLTGMTVTITPSSATAKVLVVAYISQFGNTQLDGVHLQLVRDSTALFLGDSAGSRVQATAGANQGSAAKEFAGSTIVFLDSPTSATAVVYKLQIRRGTAGTAVVNRDGADTDSAVSSRTASSITAIEVAS
jgi:hypothetical protein